MIRERVYYSESFARGWYTWPMKRGPFPTKEAADAADAIIQDHMSRRRRIPHTAVIRTMLWQQGILSIDGQP